jgi:hypothetical protein
VFSYFVEIFFSRARFALRKPSEMVLASIIPPMLAAQSAFPSGPLLGLHEIFHQQIWR